MSQNSEKKAVIVIIGAEILSGKVADQNSHYLSRELRALGVDVQRILVLPDDVTVIAEEIGACQKRFDLIFTSGGVGPTHDDVTMEGIALGVGRPLIHHPVLDQLLRKIYPGDLNPAQLKLADVPEGIELIYSERLRIPALHFENIYIFPGIPELLVKKFEAIKERFRETPYSLRKIFLTGEEEEIAEELNKTVKNFPELLLGSYPILHHRDFKVILTLESKDRAYLEKATESLLKLLPEKRIFKLE